uniref:Uncharacterized protein LOC111122198 n=1 Tax=Crassostrea virginica TaxID=6565 RepID=A0A8B8CWB0_CRAVI|nr:uncharacterized protein LOC111122198 [Crassostrea virginica]
MDDTVPIPDYPSFPLSSYMCFKILSCNAHLAWSFSEAYIDMVPMQSEQEDVFLFPLHTLIPKAYAFLLSETNDLSAVRIANGENVNEDQKAAFDCLLKFLQNQEDHAKRLQAIKTEGLNETKVCCMLAVHLFSQLVPGGHVIIDSKMKEIDKFQSCPCKCGRKVITGSTGIGHSKVWHGNPDILIKAGGTTIAVKKNDDDGGDGPEAKKEKLDEENEDDFLEWTNIYEYKFQNELFSQALTNAFVQKNQHEFSKKLVPAIGCTYSKMIVALYDPDQDILLRRVTPIDFLEDDSDKFDLYGILELWRVLNLHILGAELSDQIVSEMEPSGFKSQMEAKKVLDYYLSANASISSGQSLYSSPPLMTVMNKVKNGKFIVKGMRN